LLAVTFSLTRIIIGTRSIKVLQRMEGHFIRGYGDRNSEASIHSMPDAVEEAHAFVVNDTATAERLERSAR
jgi:hypothetical protein